MTYEAPTLAALVASVSRDVRDGSNKTFSTAEITDLINMGIAEVNRLIAKEYVDDIELVDDQYAYPLVNVSSLFRVQLWRDNGLWLNLTQSSGTPVDGWEFFNDTLYLTRTDFVATTDSLKIWGYTVRDAATDGDEIVDLDLASESLVRLYCQYTCFQRLVTSRALFQQWQSEVNNSDVSATQLLGMVSLSGGDWRDARNRARRLRRID